MIFHLISDKVLFGNRDISEICFSNTGGDLEIVVKDKRYKIEVKSTGSSAFQYFGSKDLNADYLIWVHFGSMLEQPNLRKIDIFILSQNDIKRRFKDLPKSGKLTLNKFISIFDNELKKESLFLKKCLKK